MAIACREVSAEFHEADGSQQDFQGIFTAPGDSLLLPGPGDEP